MLVESKLTKNVWAEAANTAAFLLHRPSMSPVTGKTPYVCI